MIRRAGASQRSALTPGSALVHARTAAGIALRAAPLSVGIQVVLSALMGVAPVAGAWLTKLVIDGLADRGRVAVPELLTMVLALAAIGVSNALAVALLKYFDAELGRSLAVAVQDRLYRAIDRLAGLAQMENPRFHDRLQMALHCVTTARAPEFPEGYICPRQRPAEER